MILKIFIITRTLDRNGRICRQQNRVIDVNRLQTAFLGCPVDSMFCYLRVVCNLGYSELKLTKKHILPGIVQVSGS